jgi:hypothetical protein
MVPITHRLSDVIERASWSAIQSFLAVWVVTSELTVDNGRAAGLAAIAAGLSAVFTAIKAAVVSPAPAGVPNIIHRALWTAASALAGALPVTLLASDLTLDTAEAIGRSAVAAVGAALLSLAKNTTAELALVEAGRHSDLP